MRIFFKFWCFQTVGREFHCTWALTYLFIFSTFNNVSGFQVLLLPQNSIFFYYYQPNRILHSYLSFLITFKSHVFAWKTIPSIQIFPLSMPCFLGPAHFTYPNSEHRSDTDAVTTIEAPPVDVKRVGRGSGARCPFLPRRSCTRERLIPLLLILLTSSFSWQCYF